MNGHTKLSYLSLQLEAVPKSKRAKLLKTFTAGLLAAGLSLGALVALVWLLF